MSPNALKLVRTPAVLVLLSACTADPGPPPNSYAAAAAHRGTVCDRHLLSFGDAQTVLHDPVVGTKTLPGDAHSCYFVSATADSGGSQLLVTLRPGGGKAALATFRSGQMDAYATSHPLAGVGDEAVWLPDLHEVDARRGDVLCVAQPNGLSEILNKADDAAQQRAVGAICTKVFAALDAHE